MNNDSLIDLMIKAHASLPKDAKMGIRLNPCAQAWALEMESRGLLKRREDGFFHMDDMFALYMRLKDE